MGFNIVVHGEERILEISYPPAPTVEDIVAYAGRVRQAIDGMGEGWAALVDQRHLRTVPRELMPTLAGLNAYAQLRGMTRSARVVADAPSGLLAWRMTKQALLTIPARTFETRDEALEWLREPEE